MCDLFGQADAITDAAEIEAKSARDAQALAFQLNYPRMSVGQSAMFQLADLYGLNRPAAGVQYGDFVNPQTGSFYDTAMRPTPSGGLMGNLAKYGGLGLAGVGLTAADGGYGRGGGDGGPGGMARRPTPGMAFDVGASPEERRAAAMERFHTSPDYTFRLEEGLKNLERSAAARGSLLSGGQLKAAQKFGQGMASAEYGNYVSRLMGLAGLDTGPQVGSQLAGLEQGAGSAIAGGAVGAANARASGFQDLVKLGMQAAGAFSGGGAGAGAAGGGAGSAGAFPGGSMWG